MQWFQTRFQTFLIFQTMLIYRSIKGADDQALSYYFFIFQGKEFDEDTTDGRKSKTTVTKEGDTKLITKQKAQKSGQKDVTVIREFTDAGIHVQMICEDVTSVQFFKRN